MPLRRADFLWCFFFVWNEHKNCLVKLGFFSDRLANVLFSYESLTFNAREMLNQMKIILN